MKEVSIILAAIILTLFGCIPRIETAEDLQAFVNDSSNGLSQEKTISDVSLQLTNRPVDLLVNQEIRSKKPSETHITPLREKYNNHWYFSLSISANGEEIENYRLGSQAEFGSRIQELAFGMQQHIYMVTSSRDTIEMTDYHYQRNFGIGNSSDFLLAFDKENTKGADHVKIIIKDMGLGIGTNRFKFDLSDLNNAPNITFQ